MISEQDLHQECFFQHLSDLRLLNGEDNTLLRLRAKAWDRFEELGLPTRKKEEFQYLPLQRLYIKKFQPAQLFSVKKEDIHSYILPECKGSVAVYVNGHLDLSLSSFHALPEKTLALPLKDALKAFGSHMHNQVAKLQEEEDPFALLNAATAEHALFLYIPPQAVCTVPLQILHLVKGDRPLVSPRIELFLGALSQIDVMTTVHYLGAEAPFYTGAIHFLMEEGASVNYSKFLTNLPADGWHFDALRATLKKDATLKCYSIQQGSETLRDDYRISLIGPNAEATLNGIGFLTNKNEAHTHVLMSHYAPNCRSMQLFKNVVNQSTESSFEGKIYVHKEAQKTVAFQLNHNLILNDYAQSYSKPNLEIYADDAKASHGATVGKLGEEELYYLRTRGLSLEASKALLIIGFCHEIIGQIKSLSLKRLIQEALNAYLGEGNG